MKKYKATFFVYIILYSTVLNAGVGVDCTHENKNIYSLFKEYRLDASNATFSEMEKYYEPNMKDLYNLTDKNEDKSKLTYSAYLWSLEMGNVIIRVYDYKVLCVSSTEKKLIMYADMHHPFSGKRQKKPFGIIEVQYKKIKSEWKIGTSFWGNFKDAKRKLTVDTINKIKKNIIDEWDVYGRPVISDGKPVKNEQ